MNRKTIAGICGGVMALSYSLVGCGGGHQHTYKDYYELASCSDMGYTLHCCTECDYMYADEFVMPYDHAYERCLNLALPVAQVKAAVHSNETAEYITVDGLPMSRLISDPLCEVSMHQKDFMSRYFSDLMNKQIEQENPSGPVMTFVFEQLQCPFCGDYKEKVHTISVPILYTVNVPQVDFSNVVVNASLELIPDTGSGAFDAAIHDNGVGPKPRTVSVASTGSKSTAASVPTKYKLSENGELSHDTKAEAADLINGESEHPLQLTIADSIEEIGADAFVSCSELRRVELPSALKKIGANAFGTAKLDYVIMPSGLKHIGSNAFGDCANMKYLFYCATQSDFDGITFENASDPVKSVPRYYYSETSPTADGNYWHFVDGEPEVWR